MKVFYLFLALLCICCGPGAKDGVMHISHGYYFSHSGGDQNLIEFIDGGKSKIVIKARVEDFWMFEEKIYVSRRPITYEDESGVLKAIAAKNCEYWDISLADNSVRGPLNAKEVSGLAKGCTWLKS